MITVVGLHVVIEVRRTNPVKVPQLMTVCEGIIIDRVIDHLLTYLNKGLPLEDKRDEFIEQIEKLLLVHETLMDKLAPPFSAVEIEVGKKVAKKSEIVAHLNAYQQLMKEEFGLID
ncbi:hypothetical protein [Halalkalibacter alkalisediminis]|uniref:Uncharacterized protein n=1 Tax=Halalkalibacter alkalisediminis TaxID=935616 RepID=A0ABV6NMA0_9BACI|nr:hypothetical protein [Halalkalibacter alkalisediminis]